MNEDAQAVGSGRPFTEDELRLWGTDPAAAKAAQKKQIEWAAKNAKGEGPQASPLQNKKIHGSMHDFKHGKMNDDKGQPVDNRQHAIFLALSRAGMPRTAKHEGKRIYDKTLGKFDKGSLQARGITVESLKHAMRLAKARGKSAEKRYIPKEANERSPYLAAIDRHVEELGIYPMYMDEDGGNASWINDIGHDSVMDLDTRMRAEGWGQEKEARDEIVKLTYHKSSKKPYRQRSEVLAYDAETGEIVCRFKRSHVGGLYVELPGGGIDKGEGPKTAAKREALEEAGITLKNVEQVGRCRWKWPTRHKEAMGTWADLYAGDDTYIFIAEVDTKGKPTSEEGDGWDRLQTRSIEKLRNFLRTHKKEGTMVMQDCRLAALRKLESRINTPKEDTMDKQAFLDGYMAKVAEYNPAEGIGKDVALGGALGAGAGVLHEAITNDAPEDESGVEKAKRYLKAMIVPGAVGAGGMAMFSTGHNYNQNERSGLRDLVDQDNSSSIARDQDAEARSIHRDKVVNDVSISNDTNLIYSRKGLSKADETQALGGIYSAFDGPGVDRTEYPVFGR